MTPRRPPGDQLPSAAAINQRLDARREAAPGPALQLHIGRITLQGLAQAEGRRVAAAFDSELRRLAATQPWPAASLALSAASLPPLQRAAGERPETTGRRLAARIAARIALNWSGR